MAKLWISDTHIGNPSNNIEGIFDVLDRKDWDDVYLVGDIFDLAALNNWGTISENDARFYRWIQDSLSAGKKITWFSGNHDRALATILNDLLPGIPFVEESIVSNVWTLHGDVYDAVFQAFKRFTSWGGGSVGMKFWYRAYTRLGMWKTRMTQQAKTRGCNVVICGHMHLPEDLVFNGVRYINTGDWMGSSSWLEEVDGQLTLYKMEGTCAIPINKQKI